MTAVAAEVGRQLTKDLRAQVTELERDLLARARDVPEFADALKAEYDAARAAGRTGVGFTEWRDDRVTQAAVAWVLATVFVRFCEDNGLIAGLDPAGPAERPQEAPRTHSEHFFRRAPGAHRPRLAARRRSSTCAEPATAAGLFDRGTTRCGRCRRPHDAATALLAFWRARDETGALRHDFTDPELGHPLPRRPLPGPVRARARSLRAAADPGVRRGVHPRPHARAGARGVRPRDGLRLIDPTCGSGHFLLGAFERLLDRVAERRRRPARLRARCERALDAVHGVDINPFAVAIARFRLMVAALQACGLHDAGATRRDFTIHLAVGDSLLHGAGERRTPIDGSRRDAARRASPTPPRTSTSCTDDPARRASYHVVVGNPPYITVKDGAQRGLPRALHDLPPASTR